MPSILRATTPGKRKPVTAGDGSATVPGRVMALLEGLSRPSEIPRRYRVYANRNLELDRMRLIGFDMDYTLALYDQPRMEMLSIASTVDKLVTLKGYPESIR